MIVLLLVEARVLAVWLAWGIAAGVGTGLISFAALHWCDKRLARRESVGLMRPVMYMTVGREDDGWKEWGT